MARVSSAPALKANSSGSPVGRAPDPSSRFGGTVVPVAKNRKGSAGKIARKTGVNNAHLSSTTGGSGRPRGGRGGRNSSSSSSSNFGNTISYGEIGKHLGDNNSSSYGGAKNTGNLSLEDWFDEHAPSGGGGSGGGGGGGWRGTRSAGVRGGSNGGETSSARWSEWKTVCRTRKTSATVELPRPLSQPRGLRYRVGARRREEGKRVTFR